MNKLVYLVGEDGVGTKILVQIGHRRSDVAAVGKLLHLIEVHIFGLCIAEPAQEYDPCGDGSCRSRNFASFGERMLGDGDDAYR